MSTKFAKTATEKVDKRAKFNNDAGIYNESRLMAFELLSRKAFDGIVALSGSSGIKDIVIHDYALNDRIHPNLPGSYWAFAPLNAQECTQPEDHMSLKCWEGRELRLSPESLSFCGDNAIQWRSLALTALALGMIDDARCIAGCEVALTRDPQTGDILRLSITLTGL